MAKNKIPVLTEVYTPKNSGKTKKLSDAGVELTPELLERVSAQIRPALEAEVRSAVLNEVQAEMATIRETFNTSTTDEDEALSDMRSEMQNMREALKSSATVKDEILNDMRTEMENMREQVLSSTQQMMNESKEVPEDVTSELAAKVTSQVKPKLETEITDYVLDELRNEIKQARGQVVASTQDFIDKTMADFKTEMPKMYQKSIDLAQIDLSEKINASLEIVTETAERLTAQQEQLINAHESKLSESFNALHKDVDGNIKASLHDELNKVQGEIIQKHQAQLNEALDGFLQIKGEEAEKALMRDMQTYQEKIRVDYQEQLTEQMTSALETIKQRVEENTEEQIGIMDTQVGTIQQETFAKLREDFIVEKDAIFNAAANEIKTSMTEQMTAQSLAIKNDFLAGVNGDLPDVQAVLQDNIQSILSNAIPDLEQRLRDELTEEIKQQLLNVKFVLPSN